MPFQTQGVIQTMLAPADVGVNAATVAAGNPVTSSVIDTRNRSQLTLSLVLARAAATAWTVYFEYSPNYWTLAPGLRSANAKWIRVQADSVGAIGGTPAAATISLGDATWSFTTSTNPDTMHIDLPVNAPAYRFVIDNTAGTTDTATAYVTLGNP